MAIVSIIVVDEKLKRYNRFDTIDESTEMKIRGNVIQYNNKYGTQYIVRWDNDESYLKANGYTPDQDVYKDMVNDYNAHLTAGEVPMLS